MNIPSSREVVSLPDSQFQRTLKNKVSLKVEEHRQHHLRLYYQRIIRAVRHTHRALILCPGEAKIELQKQMKKLKEIRCLRLTEIRVQS